MNVLLPFLLFLMLIIQDISALDSLPKNKIHSLLTRKKRSIEGWCSPEKSKKMFDLVVAEKPSVCVEIGVFGGASILPVALGLKYNSYGVVYAIDPWKNEECTKYHSDNDPNKKYWGKVDLQMIYQSFLRLLDKYKIKEYCRVLPMTSAEALGKVPNGIDLLHIDGNHQEEACYFDTINYFPKVKIGGCIWFDDVKWFDEANKKRTTKRSFDYLLQFCKVVDSVDNGGCILLRKERG